jgi:ERCC4-type nuclease
VGAARRRQLLRAFGSLEGVRGASVEGIAALPGFSEKIARHILDTLRGRAPVETEVVTAQATTEDISDPESPT